ncbi:MAG: FAD-dependent oxidoreductase, partial [Pseudomonadota bacterium]
VMPQDRRTFLEWCAALGAAWPGTLRAMAPSPRKGSYDVLVVGAGVFGIWTAHSLSRAGRRVAVVDAVGPAHSAASSGGETRVTRCGYGDAAIYTDWACRSIAEWQALSQRSRLPLFRELGVLWVHREDDPRVAATARTMAERGLAYETLDEAELRRRYPVMNVAAGESGFLEPSAGGLLARRSVQFLAAELAESGVAFLHGRVEPITRSLAQGGALRAVTTAAGSEIRADQFVFACGPWLGRVCPDAMRGRLFVTRQEVFYFGVDAGASGALPVWADLPFYGLPSIEGRGFKVANDRHGERVNPGTLQRRASERGEAEAREFLARRFPALARAPLTEARVCQYENTSSGDFVIDRHPGMSNVWLAGGGSGHGFKHGPAIGAHVAALLGGEARPLQRFSIATKALEQRRAVQ